MTDTPSPIDAIQARHAQVQEYRAALHGQMDATTAMLLDDIARLLAIARAAEQTRAAFADAGHDTETWYLNLTDAMVKLAALLAVAPSASPG